MRELLDALAGAPDRPRAFPEIEDAMGWPRRRIASVLGGVSRLRTPSSAAAGPTASTTSGVGVGPLGDVDGRRAGARGARRPRLTEREVLGQRGQRLRVRVVRRVPGAREQPSLSRRIASAVACW